MSLEANNNFKFYFDLCSHPNGHSFDAIVTECGSVALCGSHRRQNIKQLLCAKYYWVFHMKTIP